MLNKFNNIYQEKLFGEKEADFISWMLKAKLLFTGGTILDFGVADAFTDPPAALIESFQKICFTDSINHGYCYSNERFELSCLESLVFSKINSASEVNFIKENFAIVTTAGAKGALNLVAQAFINPGDVVAVTEPGYPIFKIQAERLGARVHELALTPENGYFPDLSCIPTELLPRLKILLVNYPNNPTGKILNQKEVDELLSFCSKHNILLINDAVYSNLIFHSEYAGCFIFHPSASSNYIEIHSLSKSLQIPGWRLGFLLCSKLIEAKIRKVLMMQSTGQSKLLQDAVALCLPQEEYIESIKKRIRDRLIRLASILTSSGFDACVPEATFFCFVPAPKGISGGPTFANSTECSIYLVKQLGIITMPWQINERSFLRFSVAFSHENEDEYFSMLDCRLKSRNFVF